MKKHMPFYHENDLCSERTSRHVPSGSPRRHYGLKDAVSLGYLHELQDETMERDAGRVLS